MSYVRLLPCIGLAAICSSLVGCYSTNAGPAQPQQSHGYANFKDLAPEKRCLLIKRQMMYNSGNNNHEAKWIARSQMQDLTNLYQANNCDQYSGG
jgi:hypothetical protein